MKKWYVYEIVNLMGTVEYVGETIVPKQRFKHHRFNKFKKRQDLVYNIVAEFDNRQDAFEFQCKLQSEYGIETDYNKLRNNVLYAKTFANPLQPKLHMKKLRDEQNFSKIVCPHCNKEGQARAMKRWHFSNCKHKIVI